MKAEEYFKKHPIAEVYKDYEIREAGNGLWLVDASVGVYSCTCNTIDGCKEFIDDLVENGVHQYNGEEVMRYLISRR